MENLVLYTESILFGN